MEGDWGSNPCPLNSFKEKKTVAVRTQVFAYKGFVGIKSDVKAEGLINDPMKPGQLGFVVNAASVDIQPEALDLLKQVKKSGDDIGEVDVFESSDKLEADKVVVFAWLGGPLKLLNPSDSECTGSSTYNAALLKSSPKVETPQDFIEAIDRILLKKES
jgi:hypothetical protein